MVNIAVLVTRVSIDRCESREPQRILFPRSSENGHREFSRYPRRRASDLPGLVKEGVHPTTPALIAHSSTDRFRDRTNNGDPDFGAPVVVL